MGAIFQVPVARVAALDELPGERDRARRARRRRARRRPPATLTIVVGAERDGLPADVVAACDRVAHIPIASRVAERRDGGDSRALRAQLGCLTDAHARPHRRAARPRPRPRSPPPATTAELEELRVRYPRPQGRAAEPAARRRRAAARAARRGRQAPPTRRARRSRRCIARARRRSSRAPSSTRGWLRDRVDVTLPGSPPQPVGRLHLLTATRREIEDVFLGLGLHRRRGARGRDRPLQLRRAQPRADAPGARRCSDTFYVRRRRRAAHAHLADADARDGGSSRRRSTSSSRAASTGATTTRRTRRSSTRSRASRSTRTSRSPTSRARCWRSPARSSAPSARSACARTSSRSPSRASRSTSPASTAAAPRRRRALPRVQGHGLAGDPRRRAWSTPTCSPTWPSTATTPSASRASPSAWASSASRCSSTACPTCGCFYDNDLRFLEQFG